MSKSALREAMLGVRKMKKIPFRFSLFVAVLAAACLPAPLFGDDSHRVKIETIRDLKLSGYNQDDEGKIKWKLEADSAKADSERKSADIREAHWQLDSLRLFTFDESGKVFAEMKSPAGRFCPEKREADSSAAVELNGSGFHVRGKGWSWSGSGHENLIRVHNDVFVFIDQPDRKLTARSRRLTVRGEADCTTLVFSGDVDVSYGDIVMSGGALEIVVAGDGSGATRLGERGRDRSVKDRVKSISGHGNVKIERDRTVLTGETAEFLPQENLFRVRGNARLDARLDESGGMLIVKGDRADGKLDEKFVEVFAPQLDSSKPFAPAVVTAEMPSLLERKKGAAANAGGRTFVSGKRMTVRTGDDGNVISLFGNVQVTDSAIRIRSETLVIETDPSAGDSPLPDITAENSGENPSVRRVVAEDSVRVLYDGRELTCGRAEVLPPKKLITLTGDPKVVSPEEKSSLSGDRVEVLLDRDIVEVFSADGNAPGRRRVEAMLPEFAELSSSAGVPASKTKSVPDTAKTKIVGDHLTLTRGNDLSTFDIFGNVGLKSDNVVGSCGRLLVFADSESSAPAAARGNAKKKPTSQIKKIIASENVKLEQNGCRLDGGRATITPAVTLKEWVKDDVPGADGNSPFVVRVEPDVETGARPRITFPGGSSGAGLKFALPADAKEKPQAATAGTRASEDDFSDSLPLTKKKKAPAAASPEPARESYIECDDMEMIAGENRSRFFLRGDVIFVSDGGAHGMCDSAEGQLERPAGAVENSRSEVKKVICRGNVRLEQDASRATGSTLEIFPPENRAVLRGNANFRDKAGIELHPGNDRFVFNLATRELLTGAAAGDPDAAPAMVSRPRIIIPKGSDRVFVIPKSVRSDSEKKK